MGFRDGRDGKESACNAGDSASIRGLGRSGTQLEYYADNQLAQPKQMITASGFDEGILDNGTAFLDMSKYAEVVYLEDGGERSVQAQITSITYNLTNPNQDRVQLGKKIVPLTQR